MSEMTNAEFVLDSVQGTLINVVEEFRVLVRMVENAPDIDSPDVFLARERITERSLRDMIDVLEGVLTEIREVKS